MVQCVLTFRVLGFITYEYNPCYFGTVPPSGIFCRLNITPLDRDNGTSNSSNTDVVEKVNFLVAASQHGGTSVAEGSP